MLHPNLAYAALAAGMAALAIRMVRVRRVRYNRVKEMNATYAHLLNDLDGMTYQEAEKIMKVSQSFDMPWLIALSLSFALFKTYAIPTISSVLCKSNELGKKENAGRRAEDTAVVIGEFLYGGGLDSERGTTALARMNFLHSRYGKLITREDKLFTLCLFIFEPASFADAYEWRGLEDIEKQARYVFWREIGARMGIDNIPPTRQGLWDWKESYASKHFVYAPTNKQVGDATFDVFLRPFPEFMKPFGLTASLVFLDDQTREAFGYPRPPAYLYTLVPALVRFKGLVVKYLHYPRETLPTFLDSFEYTDSAGQKRVKRKGFLFEPWYVDDSASALGLFAFLKPGKQWHDEGFAGHELGPERLKAVGTETVLKEGERLREGAMACPFFHS